MTALVEGGYGGSVARVTAEDSFIPLGPAAALVVLTEDDIVAALTRGHESRMSWVAPAVSGGCNPDQ